jgi:SAM-dependent methyltransferase
MFPQPQTDEYFDGFNEQLFAAVPASARTILELGCARGRLGWELKRQDPARRVIGIEVDPVAAAIARDRLDEVWEHDLGGDLPTHIGPVDCVLVGDVLEHLVDPERLLRRAGDLLADGGMVLASVPNVAHHNVLLALLRADWMYEPQGLLDATHLRFFTISTITKLFLDAGFLPAIESVISHPLDAETLRLATPLLRRYRVHPRRAIETLGAYQYVVRGSPIRPPMHGPVAEPITFVTCVHDEIQLDWNLRRSPCFDPGSRHELMVLTGQSSAAEGYNAALARARHEIVVFVHQDVYLPARWDARFVERFRQAEARFGGLGVAGVFGITYSGDDPVHAGLVVDRSTLLDFSEPLPALVDGLDEIVLAVRRDTPLRFDDRFGFHLYGTDISLAARAAGLPVAVVDAPCFHNSLFSEPDSAFHRARAALLEKWPDVRPLWSNMGRLDTMVEREAAPDWDVELSQRVSRLESQLSMLSAELESAHAQLSAVQASVFWRVRRIVHRLLRYRSPTGT